MTKKIKLLKQAIKYYYMSTEEILPSREVMAEIFSCSLGEIRTLLKTFEQCGYIYKKNARYYIFKTKQNFSNTFETKQNENTISFESKNFKIHIEKETLENIKSRYEQVNTNTTQDLIFILFLINQDFKVYYETTIYINNNELWYQKVCKSNHKQDHLITCEFTQNTNSLKLFN